MGSTRNMKVAVITGGASGIGLAVAKNVCNKGYKVIVLSRNDVPTGWAQQELNDHATYIQVDIIDYSRLQRVFREIWEENQRIDFVFANAGVAERTPFYANLGKNPDEIPPPDVEPLQSNLIAAVTTTYLAAHYMALNRDPQGGCIAITASNAGFYTCPNIPVYTASKHGAIGFMRATAAVLAQYNIRVNALCPGVVKTCLMPDAEWAAFPSEMFTPMSKVVSVVDRMITDAKMTGQTVEVILEEDYLRETLPYSDENAKNAVAPTFSLVK